METALQIQTTLSSLEDAATTTTSLIAMEEGSVAQKANSSTDPAVTSVSSALLYGVALFAIIAAALAMYITPYFLVDFACATVLLTAPVAVAQKRQLSKLGTLRQQQNDIRLTINTMSLEGVQLKESITKLEGEVSALKGVEKELESTAQRMGAQADRLYETIQENDTLQQKIQKSLEAQVMQSILTAALKYDVNDNFTFDATEIKRLKLSISQIPGVDVDSKNFDQFMKNTANKKELCLSDLMRQFRDIMNVETPEDARVVRMTPRKLVKRGFFR